MQSVLFFCVFCLPLYFTSAAQESIETVENKCIANRLVIKNYHIKVKRDCIERADDSPIRCLGWQFYYDTQNKRCDTVYEWRNPKLQPDHGQYTQMIVWNAVQKKRYYWFAGVCEQGLRSTFQIVDIDETTNHETAMQEFQDIRSLGFSSSGFFIEVPIDTIVCSPMRVNVAMEDDTLNGVSCKKISCEYAGTGAKSIYWIAPDKGYSIIRFEGGLKDGSVTSWTELDVKQDTATGLWFPSASRTEIREGGELTVSEKLDIEIISLNKPIDPSYFTPKTMDVRIGAPVIMPPLSGERNYFWDGEKIVDELGDEYPLFIDPPGNTYWYISIFLMATGFLLTGLALLLLYIKSK